MGEREGQWCGGKGVVFCVADQSVLYFLNDPYVTTVEMLGIVICGDGVVGNAGSMGKVADELQHQQAGAEEEPTGCAGRSQLV